MAGVTDWAFRTICARMGAGLTVTEMVSSRALVYRDRKSAGLLRKNEGSVVGAQIFGNDPEVMAQGAALAMEISGCDFIDINMGCPMAKVVSNGDGSALMKDIPLATSGSGNHGRAVGHHLIRCMATKVLHAVHFDAFPWEQVLVGNGDHQLA